MLELKQLVKMSCRISGDAFDGEVEDTIQAALDDLGVAGVAYIDPERDALVRRAVCTYCKLHIGMPDDADRLQKSYNEQKAQMATHTGHTDWNDGTEG